MSAAHRQIMYFLVIFITVGIIVLVTSRTSCTKLSCIQMNSLSSYHQKEIYENTAPAYRALYQRNGELLRVDVRSNVIESEAQRRIDGRIAQIKTHYADTRAPYPGEITKTIACEEHYQPSYRQESINGLSMTIVESYLTDRLTYGSCTDEQASYRSVLALFFCSSQKKLYQLEFIAAKNQFDSVSKMYSTSIRSLQCRSRLP